MKTIGLIGVPKRNIIEKYKKEGKIIDLDMPISGIEYTSKYDDIFPKPYCAILRTIFYNAMELKLDAIIIDGGMGKCDGAHYIIDVLKNLFPNIEIDKTPNYDLEGEGTPLCENFEIPLIERMELITRGVIDKKRYKPTPYIKPKVGFWGVPPKDFEILKYFPKETEIFGWTRCMENHTPYNPELELYVKPDLPTVFFAQSFCPKNVVAKFLAEKYDGLYLDVDLKPDKSAISKLEAFLKLRVGI